MNWTNETFNDLSACWLACQVGNIGMCIQWDGFRSYSLWFEDQLDTEITIKNIETIEEAKEICESLLEQYLFDHFGARSIAA